MDNDTKSKVLNELITDVKMIKTLDIGDPVYLDDPESQHVCYKKNFRRPNWLGRIITREVEHEYDYSGETSKFKAIDNVLVFAKSIEMLELLQANRHYTHQTHKVYTVGVDTAEYIIETDKSYTSVKTGSDGVMGTVVEFYDGGRLDGFIVELTADEYVSIDYNHDILKTLFTER